MPDFNASITNPTTSEPDIVALGGAMTIGDNSNYIASTEDGHLQTAFSDWIKIIVTNPDATTYTFASDGTGDEILPTPDGYSVTPQDSIYTYSDTGDGVYHIALMVVPTWSPLSPPAEFAVGDCVYHGGSLYSCILATSVQPPSNATYWEVITEDILPSKYSVSNYIAVYCCILNCLNEAVIAANPCANLCVSDSLCDNDAYQLAVKLELAVDAIEALANDEEWSKVRQVINAAKALCSDCV